MEVINGKTKIGVCPFCGKDIIKGQKDYYCSGYKDGCEFKVYRHIMGNEFDDEKVKDLIEKRETPFMDGVTKSGDKVSFRIKEDGSKFIVEYAEAESIAECPVCKVGKVYPKGKVFKCSNDSCGFFIWRETSGMVINQEIAQKLCLGQKIPMERTKKDGSVENVFISLSGKDLLIDRE